MADLKITKTVTQSYDKDGLLSTVFLRHLLYI